MSSPEGGAGSFDEEYDGQQHTQFLDLTDGMGGAPANATFDSDDGGGDGTGGGTHAEEAVSPGLDISTTAGGGRSGTRSANSNLDPSTPGKVVETGQEHTGRWTREEHEAFLSALRMYGKEWKKVAAKVKTRTVVQTRTHAQKYFQKLQKATTGEGGEGAATVEMGVASEAKKASTSSGKKRKKVQRQQSTASTHAAAHLMGLSNLTSPEQQQQLQQQQLQQETAFSAAVMQAATAAATASLSARTGSYPTHGFSAEPPQLPLRQSVPSLSAYSNAGLFFSDKDTWQAKGMSITAPAHDLASRMGKFPEPSPAATGKRKLAELAAAQMLAGVAASSTPAQKAVAAAAATLEGDVTPPEEGVARMPPVPALGPGLSLQIVNPDTMGIQHDSKPKRGGDGQASPTTPWDGQLKALVSGANSKGNGVLSQDSDVTEEMLNSIGMPVLPDSQVFPQSPRPHPVCEPGMKYGRSRLHELICSMDVSAVNALLSGAQMDTSVLQKKDEAGFCPIHSACALSMLQSSNAPEASEITRLLIAAGADVACADSDGNTPLHWAARAGDESVAQILLLKNCPADNQNDSGDTALHWAMKAGRRGMRVVRMLLENGGLASVLNKEFRRPLDVAVTGFSDDDAANGVSTDTKKSRDRRKAEKQKKRKEMKEEIREVRANLIMHSNQSKTLVLHHPECQEHVPKSDADWEVPDRVNSIMRRVLPTDSTETTGIFPHEVLVSSDFDKANVDLLSRIHSNDYLSFVNELSKDLEKRKKTIEKAKEEGTTPLPHAVPFTPMVQKSLMNFESESEIKHGDHSDTSFSAGSLRAARRAAGAVQHAVDCVLVGRHRNAFCVVRPPGHHAGVKGLLAGGESCGFCIFNSVAAGAMHAISDEQNLCQKCAIVDIDVHHGNGTEEIVRKSDDPGSLFFFSIHLYDHDKKRRGSPNFTYKFYPGTGNEDELTHNIINVPITPLWRVQEAAASAAPVPAVNSHNTRQRVRKRSGGSLPDSPRNSEAAVSEQGAPSSTGADIVRASDTESESASKRGQAKRNMAGASSSRYVDAGRATYRRAIQDRLLPALRAFNPDLILISAGFDGTKGDVGNARHYIDGPEKMGLDLDPEDYAWTTRKILEIADICCQGRVVSVLEGGYGRTPVNKDEDKRLDKSMFAESAVRHLQALIDPYDIEARFKS